MKPARCSRASSSTIASSSLLGRLAAARVGEQGAVGDGVVEEPGHQHRVEVARPVDDHAEHLDRGDAEVAQLAQQPVLAPGQALVELLERVDLPALGDEPDDVPGDAALADLDQPVVVPVLDRLAPGQGQQAGRALGRWREDETHRPALLGRLAGVSPHPRAPRRVRLRHCLMPAIGPGGAAGVIPPSAPAMGRRDEPRAGDTAPSRSQGSRSASSGCGGDGVVPYPVVAEAVLPPVRHRRAGVGATRGTYPRCVSGPPMYSRQMVLRFVRRAAAERYRPCRRRSH